MRAKCRGAGTLTDPAPRALTGGGSRSSSARTHPNHRLPEEKQALRVNQC